MDLPYGYPWHCSEKKCDWSNLWAVTRLRDLYEMGINTSFYFYFYLTKFELILQVLSSSEHFMEI